MSSIRQRSLMEDRKASSCHLYRSASAITLVSLLLLQRSWLGSCDSFCLNTLTRSYCPDLQTFDQFNITAFGGRWYEIGSNGYFKNSEEAGGTCVTADYAINTNVTNPGPNSPIISVVNSYNKQIGPIATSVVQGISRRAGVVCQQARHICRQTHQQGDLFRGLSLIDDLSNTWIVPNFSLEGDGLVKAKLEIQNAVQNINQSLQLLSSNISTLQIINSNISQAQGDQFESVSTLTDLARQGIAGAQDILASLRAISMARFQVAKIAGLLFGISNAETYLFGANSSISTEQAAVLLFKSASLIQIAEETLHGPLAIITANLAGAAQSTSMLNMDITGPSGSTPFLQGQGSTITGNRSGKLVMNTYYYPDYYNPTIPESSINYNFKYSKNKSAVKATANSTTATTAPNSTTTTTAPNSTTTTTAPNSTTTAQNSTSTTTVPNSTTTTTVPVPTMTASTAGSYWILAAEGKPENGYDAALVYGCQTQSTGGVKQPLFILSRKPILDQNITSKFFNVMDNLGIDRECAEPFVFTEQGDSCVYPPAYNGLQ